MSDKGITLFGKLALVSAATFVLWVVCLYAYRLTLHPLAKFPGPKLAACTRWYEFYYDIILKGQYVFHLPELHKKYGPIIRVSPDELHIDDPEFFDTFYVKSGRLHKNARDSLRFGNPTSVFTTANADVHRVRRAALSPFFSKRNVVSFQDEVHKIVEQMLSNIATYRGSNKPLAISLAYMAMTGDVVMEYCYGYNFDHVNSRGFETNYHELIVTASQSGALAVHFPIVMQILMSMPECFVVWGTPLFALLFKLQKSVMEDVRKNKELESTGKLKLDARRPNVIQHLMHSDLPLEEKTDERLTDEGQNFVGAGVSTTGWVLSATTFHIINNPAVCHKLRKELEAAITDPTAPGCLEWSKLEQCEYLTACIKEGIRMSHGISGRSLRLSDNVIEYGQWQIPPRTSVSMTLVDLYLNEDIFPDAKTFKPERWLGDAKTKHGEPLEKYWYGFMKGTRSCLGVNLAWLELYMALAGVFRNFHLELYETDETDAILKHDFFIVCPKLNSKGIRVLVR